MHQTTFTAPDLDAFCLLDTLGLTVTGQHVGKNRSILECRLIHQEPSWCQHCGQEGTPRDTVVRQLAHVPLGWRPTTLRVRVRRYQCLDCGSVWREDTTGVAPARAKLSRTAVLWALKSVVIDRMSIARIAACLAVSWNTANTAILDLGKDLLIDQKDRFEGVSVIGVDEHVWAHTRKGPKYVTVIIDLTPVKNRTGPSRLLDMVQGRSKKVFKQWLADQTPQFRKGVAIIAMDGFTGYKTAAAEEIPTAQAVMDPFHVVALAGLKLQQCRQRIQQATLGRRGRAGDPLYGVRRVLQTDQNILSDKNKARLEVVFENPDHREVKDTWEAYQDLVAVYRHPIRKERKAMMQALIIRLTTTASNLPKEIATFGRTLKRRVEDIVAYFDHPGTSNGPTEAINGRIEHLRGTALGFRNLIHYRLRALLDTGGFRPLLHSHL